MGSIWNKLSRSLQDLAQPLRSGWPERLEIGARGRLRLARDEHGIVHVLGEHEEDLYRGFGFAMAWDRLLQLQLYRLMAQGRVAELLGDVPLGRLIPLLGDLGAVEADRFLRGLELEARGWAALGALTPDARRLLEAYVAGANAALAARRSRPTPEQWVLPELRALEPWEPLAIALFVGLVNDATTLLTSLLVDRCVARLGTRRAEELWEGVPLLRVLGDLAPSCPGPADSAIPRPLSAPPPTPDRLAPLRHPLIEPWLRPMLRPLGAGVGGSNAWAVSGRRTASGSPLLANDPHVPLAPIPTFWYPIHLCGDGLDVEAATLVGAPVFGLGHTRRLAWGNTSMMQHTIDLVRIRRHPTQPELYWRDGDWRPLTRRELLIKVRGRKPRLVELLSGPCGLLLPGLRAHDGAELAARVVLGDAAALIEGYLRFPRDQTVQQREESVALTSQGPFAWNQLCADVDGKLALWQTGVYPVRADGHGALPHDGSGPAGDLGEPLPFPELPRRLDPERGYLVSANQRLQSAEDSRFLSSIYEPPLRADRIAELLEQQTAPLTGQQAAQLQLDVTEPKGAAHVATLLAALAAVPAEQGDDSEARRLIAAWAQAPRCTPAAVGCTLYHAFRRELMGVLFEGPLGPELAARMSRDCRQGLVVTLRVLDDPQDPWLGGEPESRPARRDELLVAAWRRALALLQRTLGPELAHWQWGRLHQLELSHPLGGLPLVGPWLGLGRHELGGSDTTTNMAAGLWDERGYLVGVGPTSRMVVDLGQPDRALWTHSTGVAGDLLSPWRGNLTAGWLAGEPIETHLGPDVEAKESIELS